MTELIIRVPPLPGWEKTSLDELINDFNKEYVVLHRGGDGWAVQRVMRCPRWKRPFVRLVFRWKNRGTPSWHSQA